MVTNHAIIRCSKANKFHISVNKLFSRSSLYLPHCKNIQSLTKYSKTRKKIHKTNISLFTAKINIQSLYFPSGETIQNPQKHGEN